MKYKVGDKVKIREDLTYTKRYYMENSEKADIVLREMTEFAGKTLTIKSINGNYGYKLDEYTFNWTDGMFEGLVEETKKVQTKKKKDGVDMKDFRIVDYKVYNNKALNVTFRDGFNKEHKYEEEKAVCNEADKFDLERGLEVCVLKHILGEDTYKQIIKEIGRQIKALEKEAADKKAQEEMIARKKAKNARRKAARQEKARQERIAEMTEAYLTAMKEYDASHKPIKGFKLSKLVKKD